MILSHYAGNGNKYCKFPGSKHFLSLDLHKSYHQIEIAEQDISKTAMVTPLGSYCFRKMRMGLCNAGASFQRFVNEVLW